jgi:hypothetical protein
MTQPKIVPGRKPERAVPEDQIGKLEKAGEPVDNQEASGRTDLFWIKCWSCGKFLSRPLTPPNYQAYTCPYCGAVNEI